MIAAGVACVVVGVVGGIAAAQGGELDLCPDRVCFSPPLDPPDDPVITLKPPEDEGLPTWPLPQRPEPPRPPEAPPGSLQQIEGPPPFTG